MIWYNNGVIVLFLQIYALLCINNTRDLFVSQRASDFVIGIESSKPVSLQYKYFVSLSYVRCFVIDLRSCFCRSLIDVVSQSDMASKPIDSIPMGYRIIL